MEKTFADGWKIAKFVKVFSLKVSRYTVAVHVYIIPYSRKFSPGENFRLFRPGASWAKIFLANYFTQWKFCHAEIFSRTGFIRGCQAILVVPHDRQSAGIQTPSFSIGSLAWCHYYPTSTSTWRCSSGFTRSFRTPWAELSPSAIAEANTAVNGMQQAKTKGSKKWGTYREIDRALRITHVCGTRYSGVACSFESSTHYFLVSNSCCGWN